MFRPLGDKPKGPTVEKTVRISLTLFPDELKMLDEEIVPVLPRSQRSRPEAIRHLMRDWAERQKPKIVKKRD
jgi:hypothetical protein